MRRVGALGGFAAVIKRGDRERGSLLLFIASRGTHKAVLERMPNLDGSFSWQSVGPVESAGSAEIGEFLSRRTRFDEDLWAIELDIAEAERFIAETKLTG